MVVREIVLRVGPVLKSISNSPSGQRTASYDGRLSFERAEICIRALPRREEKFALFIGATNREPTRFLAHFERLHQVEDAHLFEPALNHAGTDGSILQLLEAADDR